MPPTLKIVASQRDALYEQVRNHLAGLGDVVVGRECQKDYPTAERLAIEFGEDFRLMAGLVLSYLCQHMQTGR